MIPILKKLSLVLVVLVSLLAVEADSNEESKVLIYAISGHKQAVSNYQTITYFGDLIWLYDIYSGKMIRQINPKFYPSFVGLKMSFSPDGRLFAVGWITLTEVPSPMAIKIPFAIKIFDVRTGALIHKIDIEVPADHISFSPDGKLLAVLIRYGRFRKFMLLDVGTGKTLKIIKDTESFAFSPDGKILATQSPKRADIYDLNTWTLKSSIQVQEKTFQISFSPDSSLFAAFGKRRIDIYDVNTWTLKSSIQAQEKTFGISFSPDSSLIASWGKTQSEFSLKLWDVTNGNMVCTISLPSRPRIYIEFFSFAPDGKTIAVLTMTTDKQITFYDITSGKIEGTIKGDATTSNFFFTPDGKNLVITRSGDIFLIDIKTWQVVKRIDTNLGVETIEFSGSLLSPAPLDANEIQ